MSLFYIEIIAFFLKVPNGYFRRDELRRQGELIEELSKVSKNIRALKDGRAKKVIFIIIEFDIFFSFNQCNLKVDKLRAIIGDVKGPLHEFNILSFPLDPTKQVLGLVPCKY